MSLQIFQGVTTSPCRDYIAERIIEINPLKIYMPYAGRFGVVKSYINHGGKRNKIYSSDITLFTSLLGYLADNNKNIKDLGLSFEGVFEPKDSKNEINIAATVMLDIKYNQLNPKTKYGQDIRRELRLNQDKYLKELKDKIKEFVFNIKGINYNIKDLWKVIKKAKDQEDAFLFVNVPTTKNGYTRMFKGKKVEWDEPHIDEFNPDSFSNILKKLENAECTVMIYVQKMLEKVVGEWNVVYSQPYKKDRIDYIIANRKLKSFAHTKIKPVKHKAYPIYQDQEIAENSKIQIIKTDRDTALYYRDLFIHKLGTTNAESFWLMFIDGRLTTSFGLSMRDVFTQKSNYVGEVFGITKTSKRYKRLGKLFMMCLTTTETKKIIEANYNLGIRKIKGIKTTSITTHEEGKTDRGVMNLVHREKLDTGQFRVIYQGEFRNKKFSDVLNEWLNKYGHISRDQKNKKQKRSKNIRTSNKRRASN